MLFGIYLARDISETTIRQNAAPCMRNRMLTLLVYQNPDMRHKYLTPTQLKRDRMEEAGHAEEAQRAVLEALNAKLSESTRNLGFFARAWDDVKASVSDVAHAIANWGKSATIDTEVARITSRLEIARSDLLRAKDSFGDGIIGRLVGNNAAAKVAELESVLAKLRETKAQNDKLATEEGKAAKRQQEGTEARKLGDDLLNQSKSHLNLQRELTIWKERFAKAAEAGAAFTKQEQEAIVTEVTRKYTPREDKKLETEFQNLIKSLADEKVKLDAEAANWTMYGRSLDNARAAVVRFRTSQGDLRGLSDPNKAKAISAAEAADAAEQAKRKAEAIAQAERLTKTLIEEAGARAKSSREEFIARELSRENLIALDKESAAMKAVADAAGRKYDAMISTPAIKKWVEQVDEEVRKINEETAAIGMGTLARKQNEAAIKLHATAQAEAEKYPERAAEIWEKYADAVRRVKDALAKQDAASKTFGAGATKAVQQYVDDAANEAKFAENLVTGTLNRAADAFVEFAKTGKLNLSSLFSFMAEEYLRQFFRMQIASMIDPKSSFASSFSLAGIWNGITSFASGFFGHATGADYVPYDGYPALLHEGERVLTKQEARQGSGNVVHFDFSGQTLNVGQGVSRGEVANALAAQRAAIMGDVRRQVATKGYVG
jgi:lambda family phage tail tape measure protein